MLGSLAKYLPDSVRELFGETVPWVNAQLERFDGEVRNDRAVDALELSVLRPGSYMTAHGTTWKKWRVELWRNEGGERRRAGILAWGNKGIFHVREFGRIVLGATQITIEGVDGELNVRNAASELGTIRVPRHFRWFWSGSLYLERHGVPFATVKVPLQFLDRARGHDCWAEIELADGKIIHYLRQERTRAGRGRKGDRADQELANLFKRDEMEALRGQLDYGACQLLLVGALWVRRFPRN